MLVDYRIRHVNCLEFVLGNIILNEYEDLSLLFINSWKFEYFENEQLLRDKFSIYSNDYEDLYNTVNEFYGIKQKEMINVKEITEKESVIEILDANKYVALKVRACDCPWLLFLDEIHGNHTILVMDYNYEGIYCSDNSANKYLLPYDFLFEFVNEIVTFSIEKKCHTFTVLKEKIVQDIKIKINNKETNGIKLLANDFIGNERIDKELNECELITSPLIKRISLAGYSRDNYFKAVKYVFSDNDIVLKELEALDNNFCEVTKKWLLINKKITNYAILKKSELRSEIYLLFQEIAESEEFIAKKLLEILF